MASRSPTIPLPRGNHYGFVYTGEGGYEGLSAMMFALPTGIGEWDFEGVLFPSPMPEFPPLREPPAEYHAQGRMTPL